MSEAPVLKALNVSDSPTDTSGTCLLAVDDSIGDFNKPGDVWFSGYLCCSPCLPSDPVAEITIRRAKGLIQ